MTRDIKLIGRTVNHFFWTLVFQGLAFIILAILIIIYPAILVALFAAGFIIVGVSLLVLAGKVRQVWRSLPGVLQ